MKSSAVCFQFAITFLTLSVLDNVDAGNIWKTLEKQLTPKAKPNNDCVPPCKIFHSWCQNNGKCRVKSSADCRWYCECPANCEGYFCEKIVSKYEKGSNVVKVTISREKKKDVSTFGKSKFESALANIIKKLKTDNNVKENKPAEGLVLKERIGKTMTVNVTQTITIICPPSKLKDTTSPTTSPPTNSVNSTYNSSDIPTGLSNRTLAITSAGNESVKNSSAAVESKPTTVQPEAMSTNRVSSTDQTPSSPTTTSGTTSSITKQIASNTTLLTKVPLQASTVNCTTTSEEIANSQTSLSESVTTTPADTGAIITTPTTTNETSATIGNLKTSGNSTPTQIAVAISANVNETSKSYKAVTRDTITHTPSTNAEATSSHQRSSTTSTNAPVVTDTSASTVSGQLHTSTDIPFHSTNTQKEATPTVTSAATSQYTDKRTTHLDNTTDASTVVSTSINSASSTHSSFTAVANNSAVPEPTTSDNAAANKITTLLTTDTDKRTVEFTTNANRATVPNIQSEIPNKTTPQVTQSTVGVTSSTAIYPGTQEQLSTTQVSAVPLASSNDATDNAINVATAIGENHPVSSAKPSTQIHQVTESSPTKITESIQLSQNVSTVSQDTSATTIETNTHSTGETLNKILLKKHKTEKLSTSTMSSETTTGPQPIVSTAQYTDTSKATTDKTTSLSNKFVDETVVTATAAAMTTNSGAHRVTDSTTNGTTNISRNTSAKMKTISSNSAKEIKLTHTSPASVPDVTRISTSQNTLQNTDTPNSVSAADTTTTTTVSTDVVQGQTSKRSASSFHSEQTSTLMPVSSHTLTSDGLTTLPTPSSTTQISGTTSAPAKGTTIESNLELTSNSQTTMGVGAESTLPSKGKTESNHKPTGIFTRTENVLKMEADKNSATVLSLEKPISDQSKHKQLAETNLLTTFSAKETGLFNKEHRDNLLVGMVLTTTGKTR